MTRGRAARGALLQRPEPLVSGRRASHLGGLALCVSDLRVEKDSAVRRPAAQDPAHVHPASSGKTRQSNKKGPEGALTKKDAEGAARRALLRWPKPPVSGRRASHLNGLALCVSDLRVWGNPLAPAPRIQARSGADPARCGKIASRGARSVSSTPPRTRTAAIASRPVSGSPSSSAAKESPNTGTSSENGATVEAG